MFYVRDHPLPCTKSMTCSMSMSIGWSCNWIGSSWGTAATLQKGTGILLSAAEEVREKQLYDLDIMPMEWFGCHPNLEGIWEVKYGGNFGCRIWNGHFYGKSEWNFGGKLKSNAIGSIAVFVCVCLWCSDVMECECVFDGHVLLLFSRKDRAPKIRDDHHGKLSFVVLLMAYDLTKGPQRVCTLCTLCTLSHWTNQCIIQF